MSELPQSLSVYREQLREAISRDLAVTTHRPFSPQRGVWRRRGLGFSAAAAMIAIGLAIGATVTATSSSAYGAANQAVAATAAASSGTITGSVTHDEASYALDTTQWNGDSIAVTGGDTNELGPSRALLIIGGGAYVEQPDGIWWHYASTSGVGPKVGPMVDLARSNVTGNTAARILSLASEITQTSQPNGSTVYSGTIPNSSADTAADPSDDLILRTIINLSNGPDNLPGAPGGFHNGLELKMTVGADGLVQQVSLSYQQQGTGSAQTDGSYTWTISYSQLGSTAPIEAPATSTPTPPVKWSPGPACTSPCGG